MLYTGLNLHRSSSYITTMNDKCEIIGIMLYILIGQRTHGRTGEPQTVETEAPTARVLIRWRQLLPFLIMSVTTETMIQSVEAYFSLYAVANFGVAKATAAMPVAITPAVGLFTAPPGGHLSDRLGGVPVLVSVCLPSVPLTYLLGVVPNVPTLATVMAVVGIE